MNKDNKDRALYYDDYFRGHFIKVKGVKYEVARANKYAHYSDTRCIVIIKEQTGNYYLSDMYSNIVFANQEEAWKFIDEEILTGKYNWKQDMIAYKEKEQAKKEAAQKARELAHIEKAAKLKAILDNLGLTANQFDELVNEYQSIDYKQRFDILGLVVENQENYL